VKVLLLSTAPDLPTLPRPRLLREALRAAGVEVLERTAPARRGGGSRARALSGAGAAIREGTLGLLALARLLARGWLRPVGADAILVPYGGTLDPWIARRLARPLLRAGGRIPVVVDAFLSLHEAAVEDRLAVAPGTLRARGLAFLDRLAVRCGDLLLVDTQETGRLFADRYGAREDRICEIPVGSDLPSRPLSPQPPRLRALFVGTGIPFHGVATLLDALDRLERDGAGIDLTFVGGAPEDRDRAARLPRARVLPGPVGRDALADLHAGSDLVLGVFGAGPKADRVVPCKVYDGLASGRAVVTGESRAARRLLAGIAGVVFVPREDARALAQALAGLLREPGRLAPMGAANRRAFEARFGPGILGGRLRAAIEEWRPSTASRAFPARIAPT
jgi:glycosyltransferase involved in cell wall biosynthesis